MKFRFKALSAQNQIEKPLLGSYLYAKPAFYVKIFRL